MEDIKAVVFDLGGVLFSNPNIKKLWKNKPGARKIRKQFGSGQISKKRYVEKASKLLRISEEEFTKEDKEIYYGINLIKDRFKVFEKIKLDKYILSDTNPVHVKGLKENFPELFQISKKVFLSYKIKLRKDNLKVFRFLLKQIKLPSKNILYIDDKPIIIKRAKKLGIKTILCKNTNQFIKDIKKLNIK